MIKLEFVHPDLIGNQDTYLTAQANTGDTTLNVADSAGFAKGDLVLVGNYGSEKTEIVQVSTTVDPTDTVITLETALKFSHTTNVRITIMNYDKIEVSRANSELGTYTTLDTIDIAVDESYTSYTDTAGDWDKWYKIRYYNSKTTEYSTYSSPISATGYKENSVITILRKGKRLFSKYSDKLIDRDTWIEWLNEGYRIMINRIKDLGFDWGVRKGSIIHLVANQDAYDLPSDFLAQRRFWIRYSDTGTHQVMNPMDFSLYDPNITYSSGDPHYYLRGKSIVVVPTPTISAGDILPFYYYLPAQLEYDMDTLDENYVPASKAYIITNYMLQKALEMDKRFDEAAYYGQTFENQMDLMIKEMEKRYPEVPSYLGEWGESFDNDIYPFN